MSLFKNLGGFFKAKPGAKPESKPTSKKTPRPSKKTKKSKKPQPPKPSKPSYDDKKHLSEARAKAKEIILEAKDEAIKIRQKADSDARSIIGQVEKQKEEIFEKKNQVDQKAAALNERAKMLKSQQKTLKKRLKKVEEIKTDQIEKLKKISQMTKDEAKDQILKDLERTLTEEIALEIKKAEEKISQESEEKAKEILVDAMYHGANDYVAEYTVSTVKLPDEEMKGRVIGREGRNIRAFEKATGVDVDLDEEGIIRLSSFDPVRREVARLALEKLIADGRIQPSRIEETVGQIKKHLDRVVYQEGEKLCHRLKVFNLPREIISTLGRFKYRFSYGQNLISHTLEETKMAVKMAHELNLDVNVVKMGCLLHDIGKVLPDADGSHVELGVDYLKRFNIPKKVVDCVAEHHEDRPFSSAESVIVYVADAISGSRPGARYEDYEEYVQRLERLEEIATSFNGVKDAFAIQAGREIRVVTDPGKVDDTQATKIAHDIKQKIEKEVKSFPGQIKVIVIREFRQESTATPN